MTTEIKIKKLSEHATIPTRGSEEAAGCDLYANIEEKPYYTVILPDDTEFIKTGISMEIPEGFGGFIYARSGLASKRGLRPANCVGVVDSDYRGEIIVALHNDSIEEQAVGNGDRIAQMVFAPYLKPEFVEVESLTDTERGDGGFGHTGK